jgi:hypothetical protein
MGCLVGLVSAVAGSGFQLFDCALQPFLMGRGEGPKLNADAVPAGPAHDGALDQDRGPSIMDVEQKIDMHSRDGSQGAFKPTTFAREIQRFADLMESILVDEGARKGCGKSGILSDHHN